MIILLNVQSSNNLSVHAQSIIALLRYNSGHNKLRSTSLYLGQCFIKKKINFQYVSGQNIYLIRELLDVVFNDLLFTGET